MTNSNPTPDIAGEAASWQTAKHLIPGVAREAVLREELGDRVADALYGVDQ